MLYSNSLKYLAILLVALSFTSCAGIRERKLIKDAFEEYERNAYDFYNTDETSRNVMDILNR